MFEPTLSIDLGASYTKIAYRHGCLPDIRTTRKETSQLLVLENSALIPSLAVSTGNKAMPWVFGRAAAGLTPTKGTEVFLNWKSNLFRPHNDKQSAEAVTVAGRFFGWLREQIELTGLVLRDAEVRVAMPAFSDVETKAVLIARCMELNGWDSPKILKVTEPRANAIGLFARGRNAVAQNGAGAILLHYNTMFGQNIYMRVARDAALFEIRSPIVTTLIVDIGAFTTDIAALTFDTRSQHDGLADIRPESYPLGVINELDRPLFAAMGARHSFDWAELSFLESEIAKRAVYGGQSYSLLLNNPPRTIEVGGTTDSDLLSAQTTRFADQIWEKISAFTRSGSPSIVYLTGGGSLIAPVARLIKDRLKAEKIGCSDTSEAEAAEGVDYWRDWPATGESLARVATALGGSSVILQASAEEDGRHRTHPIRLPQPESEYVNCRCQGGNKDCCRCGGRGFHRRG
jgi:hypothetical protein